MTSREMDHAKFDQLIAASGLCSNVQLLDLADCLHAMLRLRRHPHVAGERLSFDPPSTPLLLDDDKEARI